jgi:hypothetical protein
VGDRQGFGGVRGDSYVFVAYQGYGMWGGLWYFGDSRWEPGMAQGGAVELNLIAARHFCSIILHASNVSYHYVPCHLLYDSNLKLVA